MKAFEEMRVIDLQEIGFWDLDTKVYIDPETGEITMFHTPKVSLVYLDIKFQLTPVGTKFEDL